MIRMRIQNRNDSLISSEDTVNDNFTVSEEKIIQLVADGFTDREIGERADMTASAVKFHLGNIYRKLNIFEPTPKTPVVNKRVALVRWWWSWEGRPNVAEITRAEVLLERMEEVTTVLCETDKRLRMVETLLTGALQNTRHTTVKIERALAEVHALVEGVEAVSEAA